MEYLPIRVSTLRGDQKIDFDSYIKINDKFILYLRRGDSFEGNRLDRLKAKKLRKMFILPDDEMNYRKYLRYNIERAFNKDLGAEMANRSAIIQGSQQSQSEELMENPENEIAYLEAKESASKFVRFLLEEDSAFAHLMKIENVDQNLAHHGVTVSIFSVGIAKRLGITDPHQLQLLTVGALLHDIGSHQGDINLSRPVSQFSPEDLMLYQKHPEFGAARVRDKLHMDKSVLAIVAQHEEYIDGRGFPMGLTESRMDPLAVIVSSANALDRLMCFEQVPKNEAVKKLLITAVGKYPLNHIQILGDMLNQMKI